MWMYMFLNKKKFNDVHLYVYVPLGNKWNNQLFETTNDCGVKQVVRVIKLICSSKTRWVLGSLIRTVQNILKMYVLFHISLQINFYIKPT